MEENTNKPEDNLDDRSKTIIENSINSLLEEKELKTKWRKEIDENQSMQEYFKGYHPASIESFISTYLSEKYHAFTLAESYQRQVETNRTKWIDAAYDHLKIILNKQLFDLQCKWRAEQIELKEVQICNDFEVWRDNIFNCPFLEPITEEEIENYQYFLLNTDVDYNYMYDLHDLQNYDEFKEDYLSQDDNNNCLEMPDWYEFHNSRTGNGSLLLLPDIRGEKEEFYMNLSRNFNNKDLPKSEPYIPETRPWLMGFQTEIMSFFVKTFENSETQKKYANYFEAHRKNRDETIDIHSLLYELENEDETIPIEAHYDYSIGLEKAVNKFKLNKLAEHLPIAHGQYLFNLQMGFQFEIERDFPIEIRKIYADGILKGRELNGEPRDFNF